MTCETPMRQAEDFRAECQSLYDVLQSWPEEMWEAPTAFKGWSAIDILGHLHMADKAAMAALDGAEAFSAAMGGFLDAVAAGEPATAYTRRWHGLSSGPQLCAVWWRFANALADAFCPVDPRRRIPWGRGPDMSARSCMGARQMEVWAHGQALFDLMGVVRKDTDRLRNIAMLGVATLGWSFAVRGLAVPQTKPYIRLIAPSGAVWEWHDPASADRIEGTASAFCQIVTQTRHLADTGMVATGDVAQKWLAIAQCFAGPPQNPPAPGSRRAGLRAS